MIFSWLRGKFDGLSVLEFPVSGSLLILGRTAGLGCIRQTVGGLTVFGNFPYRVDFRTILDLTFLILISVCLGWGWVVCCFGFWWSMIC